MACFKKVYKVGFVQIWYLVFFIPLSFLLEREILLLELWFFTVIMKNKIEIVFLCPQYHSKHNIVQNQIKRNTSINTSNRAFTSSNVRFERRVKLNMWTDTEYSAAFSFKKLKGECLNEGYLASEGHAGGR